MRWVWRIAGCLVLVSVLAWMGLIWTGASLMRPGVGLPAHFGSPMRTDGEIIHIRLAGVDYWIPANYFEAVLEPGIDQDGALLQVLLPDLEPRTQENWDEFMRVPGFGQRATILVRPILRDNFSLEIHLNNRINNHGPLVDHGFLHGLRHLRSVEEAGPFRRRDILIGIINNEIIDLLDCTIEINHPNNRCEHYFIYRDSITSVLYSRDYLPDWRRIGDDIQDLLTRFTVAPIPEPIADVPNGG